MAFEAILSQQQAAPSRWRRITLTFSVLLHGVALAVGVAHSIWQVEEMPMPAIQVTLSVAPPPPPPPPPPKRSSTKAKTKPVETKPKAIVAPKETPKEAEPEAAEEESEEDEAGEDGGQEGGVAGGVIGGIVGGTAPPPPKSTGPKILSQGAGHKLLAINPYVRPYKVLLDEELFERQDSYSAVINICVAANGTVSSVKVVKQSTPELNVKLPITVKKWKYKPYLVDGKPSPFCYPMLYKVTAG